MNETLTPDRIQAMLDSSPFIKFLGLRVIDLDGEALSITLRMPARREICRGPKGDQLHGGAIASLIDTAGDYALALVVGAAVPTINYRVDYLRPAFGDGVEATATVRRAGRTIGVVDIDVVDEQRRLVAVGRGCYSMVAG